MPLFGPPNVEKLKRTRDVKGLLKALGHKDPAIRLNAENALNELGTAAVEPLIDAALYAWNANVREAAMEALRKLGTAALIARLEDEDAGVRGATALALGQLEDTGAVEPLIAALEDDEAGVCVAVALALGELGDARGVEPLIAALEDEDVGVRAAAAAALGELKDARAVEPLFAALDGDDEVVASAAAAALERMGGPELERALEEYRQRRT